MLVIWIKKSVNSTGNPVYLTESSDTEKSDTYAKKGEQLGKPFPFLTHALFNIIKRAAETMSVLANDTILDGEKTLGKFGCHSKESGYDHPEKCSRSSGTYGCCNADDIAGTDGGT